MTKLRRVIGEDLLDLLVLGLLLAGLAPHLLSLGGGHLRGQSGTSAERHLSGIGGLAAARSRP